MRQTPQEVDCTGTLVCLRDSLAKMPQAHSQEASEAAQQGRVLSDP